MGRVRRRRAERPLDDAGNLLVLNGPRPSRPRLVRQPLDALLQEAPPPLADRALVHAELGGYRLVAKPVCATQDHAAAIRRGTRDPAPADLTLKPGPLLIAQNQGCQRPTETTCHRGHGVLAGRGLYQCNRCKKQTSPTAGTIFHATKLPLTLWFAAIHLIVTAKNGISSVELGRRLGVKQPTAWAAGAHSKKPPAAIGRSAPGRADRRPAWHRSNG